MSALAAWPHGVHAELPLHGEGCPQPEGPTACTCGAHAFIEAQEENDRLRAALTRALVTLDMVLDYYCDVNTRYQDDNEPLLLHEAEETDEQGRALLGLTREDLYKLQPAAYERMGWHDEDDEEAVH